MAIKFAGICGKEVLVHGRNRIGWALRADWLSFTNLGHLLKSHKIEQPNSVARGYNRVYWEYIGVKMEIDSLTMLLF